MMARCSAFLKLLAFCCSIAAHSLESFSVQAENVIANTTDVRVDCHPQGSATQTTCEQRGCTWYPYPSGVNWCTFPEGYGYQQSGPVTGGPHGFSFKIYRMDNPGGFYGNDIHEMDVEFQFQTNERLRIVIKDAADQQFKIPEEALKIDNPQSSDENTLYEIEWVNEPQFGFRVMRRSTGHVIFDTTIPGLQFADQYIQFATRLNSGKVYGFGEHRHGRFMHNMNWRRWGIFTKDTPPTGGSMNLYGQQPFYMNIEQSNNAHGVLLVNSNAMEVELQPDPNAISWRVTGGIFDLYIFMGPSPENVVQQYTEATGRPYMPTYWSLGFQLGRYSYDTLNEVREVVYRNVEAGIPLEVMNFGPRYRAGYISFTVDQNSFSGFAEYVDELHTMGIKTALVQDSAISNDPNHHNFYLEGGYYKAYTEGIQDDIFIRDARDNSYLEGRTWPGSVHYPDYSKNEGFTWWMNQCYDLYYNETWRIKYDAFNMEHNEPRNFDGGSTTGCDNNDLNCPPFPPKTVAVSGCLYDNTICMDAATHWGLQYNTHSLYGHSTVIVAWNTWRQLWPEKRSTVITRSQFTGSQKYAGHYFGENQSNVWSDISWSIIAMLEYSLFGFSYTGSDICGHFGDAGEELCQRWHQLGAFYPYSRNHNRAESEDQDPAAPRFSQAFRTNVREILLERYRLLPFLYTLMHEAHTQGSTVVRPLLNEFVYDTNTHEIDTQFLWGPSLLISPALSQGQTVVRAYIPDGQWYNYFTGEEVIGSSQFHDLDTPLEKINVHVRGGYIIPYQEPGVNTEISRTNPMGLVVALGSGPNYAASGSLFWDDGISFETFESGNYKLLEFAASKANESNQFTITSTVTYDGYSGVDNLLFEDVLVDGLPILPIFVRVDGADHTDYSFNITTGRLSINNIARYVNNDFMIVIN